MPPPGTADDGRDPVSVAERRADQAAAEAAARRARMARRRLDGADRDGGFPGARDGGGGANATDDAETEKTHDEEAVGKPPAGGSDPPAVFAAIDLTADDDDDVPTSGKDEPEPEPEPEPERTRAFDERANVARKGEAHDDRLERLGAAKDPSTDLQLQQTSGAVPNRATSDKKAPRATNEARPSVSVAAPSPALEQQVMAFFKRRRDERLAHTPEADAEPQETPEERPGTRARTEDAENAAAKTAKPDSPERVLPARVPDEKTSGGDPLAVSERAVSDLTGKTEKNLDDPRYHRAPPGYFEPGRSSKLVRATTRFADAGFADFEPSLLRAMPGAWAYAAIGPEAALAEACDAFPKGRPVQFVKRMRNAHGRWGLALETRAGCVRLCTHDPARPGRPTKLWFPLEALRALPADGDAEDGKDGDERDGFTPRTRATNHVVRLLSDVSLVTRLCDTLPSESPVRFVRAIGYRCGSVGALAESRGAIVKVRFEASYSTLAEDEKRRLSAEASEALKRPFTTWLPVECVAIVTPWE
jgi:hypothetical protein